jgi:NAD-dependent SIR2 family protein deacetylase
MVWTDAFTTSIFYMFISSLRQKIQNEVKSTTETHKFIKVLRDGGRLVRNYTQNIDSLEEREGLCTDLTRGPGNRARFHSKTQREPRPLEIDSESAHSGGVEVVLLHGSLVNLRCGICTKLSSWDEAERESATLSGQAPDCPSCTEYNTKRTGNGRRGLAVGRLRPDIVLYGEEHPHANLVSPLITHDLGLGPDVLLIMGTSLKVHGLKVMVKEFAKAVHTRGGKVVFVNRTKPPESIWGDVIDYWVEWDCDTWVLDLKERREDIWLPQGAIEEKRKESPGDTKQSSKKMSRPQCTRDDKMNGIYMTFKILDTLRNATDEKGKPATRFTYWERTSRVSNVSDMQIEVERKPTPAKRAARKSEPIKKATKSQPAPKAALSASKKRKSYPTCLRDDKYNMAHLTTTIWQNLRLAYPGLSETPPEISHPILQERCLNIPSTTQKFAFNGESNHLPNVGWGIENFNLVTHPPSGASMPVHTPKRVERKPNNHSHATRLSSRFSENTIVVDVPSENHEMEKEHTIVVETEKVETDVKEGDEENSMPTPPGSDPMTPSSSRIKRIGSISAILSSDTEEGSEEWHDAPEVMT